MFTFQDIHVSYYNTNTFTFLKELHSSVQASTGFIQKDSVRFGFTCNQHSTTPLFKTRVRVCLCVYMFTSCE